MTHGIMNLYETGVKGNLCLNLPNDILKVTCNENQNNSILYGCCEDLCGDNCYNYENPFNWGINGILIELLMMFIATSFGFITLILFETNILNNLELFNKKSPKKNDMCISNGNTETKNKNLLKIESHTDSDVAEEKHRLNDLLNKSVNNYDLLMVYKLKKKFTNNFIAVKELSFGVKNQECFGLLGINGAGKTTTFKMLVGDLVPTKGNAFIFGYNLKNSLRKYQQQIGYCPQFDALLSNLTGEELLYLFARLRGVSEKKIDKAVFQMVKMVDLTHHYKQVCSTYSGGNKRKLSLAIALIGSPKIVFLDEPTAGVDPEARRKIWDTLAYFKRINNCSIVLTSHSMEECENLCSKIAIMVKGEFKCLGSIQHLRAKYGQGFSLFLKLKIDKVNNSEYLLQLQSKVNHCFNKVELKDVHQTVVSFQIKDSNIRWSYLFKKMDLIKQEYDLEDYIIGDTTLEQIFINFARQQTNLSD